MATRNLCRMSAIFDFSSALPVRRVLLVEDHAPTVAAVARLIDQLRPEMGVIGTAADLVSARTAIRETKPDVVVLDLDLGGEDGLDLLPALNRAPAPSVVVLSVSDDESTRKRALAAGAQAFVSKLAKAEELLSAILARSPQPISAGPVWRSG